MLEVISNPYPLRSNTQRIVKEDVNSIQETTLKRAIREEVLSYVEQQKFDLNPEQIEKAVDYILHDEYLWEKFNHSMAFCVEEMLEDASLAMSLEDVGNELHILIPDRLSNYIGTVYRQDSTTDWIAETYGSPVINASDADIWSELQDAKMYSQDAKTLLDAINGILVYWTFEHVDSSCKVMKYASIIKAIASNAANESPLVFVIAK